jgi:hypothetical protein
LTFRNPKVALAHVEIRNGVSAIYLVGVTVFAGTFP